MFRGFRLKYTLGKVDRADKNEIRRSIREQALEMLTRVEAVQLETAKAGHGHARSEKSANQKREVVVSRPAA